MRKTIYSLAAIAMLSMAYSCSDDPEFNSVAPAFDALSVSKSTVKAGETVTAQMSYITEGKNWYTTYTCTATNDDSNVTSSNGTLSSGSITSSDSKPITFTFAAPKTPGTYTLTFSVKDGMVQATSGFPGGTIYANATIKNKTCKLTVE